MDNLELIVALSQTSAFHEATINPLLIRFKENVGFDSSQNDQLLIRQCLSAYGQFPDAQADFQCQKN